MSSRREGAVKRVLLTGIVVLVLAGAGGAGALVAGHGTVIHEGQWARLESTSVYCQGRTETANGAPAFDCNDWGPTHVLGGSYRAILDQRGVGIYRWDASGRYFTRVGYYANR
jgi:hypothetical protein